MKQGKKYGGIALLGVAILWSCISLCFPPKKVIRLGIYAGSSWGVPNSRKNRVIDRVIARFQKEHPDIEIVYESGIPKGDYKDWLADSILEGRQPDVFILPEDELSLLAKRGVLRNLETYLTEDMRKGFYSVSYQSSLYQGQAYALPFESNPIMMCVNKDLLEKEGVFLPSSEWTLSQFYESCRKLTKDTNGDGIVDQYGVVDYTWKEAFAAYDGQLFTKDGVNVNSPEMRESLAYVAKLQALNQHYQVSSQDFDEGKVAFYPMTLAQYRTYKPYPYHVSKYSSFEWTCVQMPAARMSSNATQVSTSLFAMSSKAKMPAEAWELLVMLCADKATQQELFEKSQGMSVLKSVMTSQATQQLLKADDFGADSLTVSTLNSAMDGAEVAQEKLADSKQIEKIDYFISTALKTNQIDHVLPLLQKEIAEEGSE